MSAHVLVEMYGVNKVSFEGNDMQYFVGEVSLVGLQTTPAHGEPFGCIGYGEDEKSAKLDIREQLKELGFSKKQIEYRRIKLPENI